MGYVDGFVLPVKTSKMAAYKKLAKIAAKVWKEHGALDYKECVLEETPKDFGMPFAKLVKPKRGESILFSWILYKSKADRKRVIAKVMSDKRLKCDPNNMPFDLKRMAQGGFKVLIEA
ncbi:MAG: DUF1428 domain-containing protein [Phycisphaerales bacterium]|jgi:uncharacterized protein YbaA (DUF1428 family)|nr:DUF1428 domain-containing protein [Phycisphaerales bacterium]